MAHGRGLASEIDSMCSTGGLVGGRLQRRKPYLSGTFRICQLCGFWHFSAFSTSFASMCKHVVTLGGGGMCILL